MGTVLGRCHGARRLAACLALAATLAVPASGAAHDATAPAAVPATAGAARAWEDRDASADARASALVAALTLDEKFILISSWFGLKTERTDRPPGALGSAGFVPGIARLGIPSQQLADAGLGVTNPGGIRPGDHATALPSGPATASTWNRAIAFEGGRTMGREAWRQGFNVLLAGSVNLQRDPRNGRNFEYAGEDPLLAGTLVGESIRGVQSQHVVSTMKHYALNDMETARNTHSAEIGERAMHESDLLAFRIALEVGDPGSVMCAYNKVNGIYACEHDDLLNRVLKQDWQFRGYVMSDWGGVHSGSKAALAGLDQQSAGEIFDKARYFDVPLRMAVEGGVVPMARLDNMVHRILRSFFAHGAMDHPAERLPMSAEIDALGAAAAQRTVEEGAVLLRNADALLPLSRAARRIAVIGGQADVGVYGGGGSSSVAFTPAGGNARPGLQPTTWPGPVMIHPSSPLAAMRALAPDARIDFVDGRDVSAAVRLARAADVVVVFAAQWIGESVDLPDMRLPDRQDALVAAVAAANPRTVVVLETNGPVELPWLQQVGAVLQAWYPGSRGGEAIARLLFGEVNPSGRLPVTWPTGVAQLPRPSIPGLGFKPAQKAAATIDYAIEGANVGYRWFAKQGLVPQFPFGHGLSYTTFAYDGLSVRAEGPRLMATFTVRNTGSRTGAAVAQLYVHLPDGRDTPLRLAGWDKRELQAGESQQVTVALAPRMLADYDVAARDWHVPAGRYGVVLGSDATDVAARVEVEVAEARLE